MDIDLLSKMVKELILDNDRVALPGLGYFAAEVAPSTFSDRGYTINPPYRKLYFRQDSGRDGLLSRLYAEHNGTGTDVAEHIIEDFVLGMREILDKEKVIVFPGLGRLRATKENYYFFVPDEELDIYPEGFGLEPVSLKNNAARIEAQANFEPGFETEKAEPGPETEIIEAERTESVDSEPVKTETGFETEKTETVEIESDKSEAEKTEPDKPEAEKVEEEPEAEEKHTVKADVMPKSVKILLVLFAVLLVVAILALGVFVLLADLCPDFIDSILYSPEELEILRSGSNFIKWM